MRMRESWGLRYLVLASACAPFLASGRGPTTPPPVNKSISKPALAVMAPTAREPRSTLTTRSPVTSRPTSSLSMLPRRCPRTTPAPCPRRMQERLPITFLRPFTRRPPVSGTAGADRTLTAHRPAVPQCRRRPDWQLSARRRNGATTAACTASTLTPVPIAMISGFSIGSILRSGSTSALQGPVPGKTRTATSSRSAGKARCSPRRRASTSSSSAPSTRPGSGSTTRRSRSSTPG